MTVLSSTHLGGIGIQSAVIDVDPEVNKTCKSQVLFRSANRRVCEKKGHGNKCTDHHCIAPSKEFQVAQIACKHRTEYSNCVGDHVIPPRVVGATLACLSATACEILGEEDVEERVGKTYIKTVSLGSKSRF